MNSVAGLKPEMESEAVYGGHGSFSGGFARKPASDQKQRIGMIGIHVPDDFLRRFGQGIGPGAGVFLGRDPPHYTEAADEVDTRHIKPVIREVGILLPDR